MTDDAHNTTEAGLGRLCSTTHTVLLLADRHECMVNADVVQLAEEPDKRTAMMASFPS